MLASSRLFPELYIFVLIAQFLSIFLFLHVSFAVLYLLLTDSTCELVAEKLQTASYTK